jgi:hypothetical protein
MNLSGTYASLSLFTETVDQVPPPPPPFPEPATTVLIVLQLAGVALWQLRRTRSN